MVSADTLGAEAALCGIPGQGDQPTPVHLFNAAHQPEVANVPSGIIVWDNRHVPDRHSMKDGCDGMTGLVMDD